MDRTEALNTPTMSPSGYVLADLGPDYGTGTVYQDDGGLGTLGLGGQPIETSATLRARLTTMAAEARHWMALAAKLRAALHNTVPGDQEEQRAVSRLRAIERKAIFCGPGLDTAAAVVTMCDEVANDMASGGGWPSPSYGEHIQDKLREMGYGSQEYRVTFTYYVEAHDRDSAAELAAERARSGASPDDTDAEETY